MKGKELKKIIDLYRSKTGKTSKEIIEKSKIPQKTYYRLFERLDDIEEHYIGKLEKAGIPGLHVSNTVNEPESNYGNASPYVKGNGRKNLIVVPLKAFGGFLAGYKDKVYMDSLEHHTFPWIHGECFAFEVDGFSMYKTRKIDGDIFEVGYKPGSFVVATPVGEFDSLMKGREYVFQTVDGIIIKRFKGLKGDYCEIESINEEYNPVKPLHLKSVKAMYYVEHNIKKP